MYSKLGKMNFIFFYYIIMSDIESSGVPKLQSSVFLSKCCSNPQEILKFAPNF